MNSTGLGSSNSSDNTANNISLAAAILAAGAFVISFAQALLEYFSSSESRNKCTYQAIGTSAKQVRFGWQWRFWKMRVQYPLLDLSWASVSGTAVKCADQTINHYRSPLMKLADEHGWRNSALRAKDRNDLFTMTDAYTKVVTASGETVTTKHLTWRECLTLLRWKYTHPSGPMTRPRASWAQLLVSFGITDTSRLKYKLEDADIIPGSVDVPIQRIRLFDLGVLAFALGFKTVKIKLDERYFEAVGEFGTISTLVKSDLGKVLRFEGDILAISREIYQESTWLLVEYTALSLGKLFLTSIYRSNMYSCSLRHLPDAILDGWSSDRFENELKSTMMSSMLDSGASKGALAAEAALFGELYRSALQDLEDDEYVPEMSIPSWLRDQKAVTVNNRVTKKPTGSRNLHGHVPTDMDEIASNPMAHINVEKRTDSFEPKPMGRTSTGLTADGLASLIKQSPERDIAALAEASTSWKTGSDLNIPTLIATASFAMLSPREAGFPSGLIIEPFFPWLKLLSRSLLERCKEDIVVSRFLTHAIKSNQLRFLRKDETFWYCFLRIGTSHEGDIGWIHRECQDIYTACEMRIQKELIVEGEAQVLLFPDCYSLLESFDTKSWSAKIQRILSFSIFEYRPVNMLWAQICLLDVAIHYLLRGGFYTGPEQQYYRWTMENVAVIQAIVNSWDRDPKNHHGITREQPHASSSKTDTSTSEPEALTPQPGSGSLAEQSTSLESSTEFNVDLEAANKPLEKTSVEVPTVDPAIRKLVFKPRAEVGSAENISTEPHLAWTESNEKAVPLKPPSKSDSLFFEWDLLSHLRQQQDLVLSEDPTKQEKKLKKLSTLLQLRSIFYIAFLSLNPDSSDVYLAEKSQVEMPMI